MSVPREGTRQAAMEAISSGKMRLVNILTEGLPRLDSAYIVQAAKEHGVRVVGPASVGLINPIDRVKLGAIGGNDPGVFYPGEIAIFSKSGGMCLSIATEIFNVLGHGTSVVVGIGGDRISGTNFRDLLEMVRDDERTKLVILNGEVGGRLRGRGRAVHPGNEIPQTGHRPDHRHRAEHLSPRLADGSRGRDHRRRPLRHLREQGRGVRARGRQGGQDLRGLDHLRRAALPRRRQDFEAALSKEFELVSISKQKLEGLKSQVRAVQIRTHMTQIIDGMPHFRGRPLPQLMRQASVPQMIFEALTKEDDGQEQAAQLARDIVLCATTNPTSEAAKKAAQASFQGGSPMNAAISAGLLTLPVSGQKALPASLHDRYWPAQADALALIPQVIDLVAAILGRDLHWSDEESIEATIFFALSGRKPSAAEANLLRATFISCVDHTPATPSSLAAITSYSGGNSLKTALAAGISAMGESHAGAGEGTARILMEFLDKMRQAPGGVV